MTTTLYTAILLIFLALFLAALLLVKYEIRQQRLLHMRNLLRKSVYRLRLSKMLAFLGVDIEKYVRKVPRKDIIRHIQNCKSCPQTPTCDACLRDGKVVNSMYFCPNFKSLTRHSRTLYDGH
ncbi:MAG: hypothetical protein ACC707_10005 [Thiohalomonadales bacterium]